MMALSLSKVAKRQIAITQDELRPWGLTSWVVMGGKHPAVRVQARDGSIHRLTICCSPTNGDNALDHARQNARRLIRLINGRAGY